MRARSWREVRAEAGLDEAEVAAVRENLERQVQAYRLAEARARRALTQREVAQAMGVSQARVSHIERGELPRTEVETLRAYVSALGGSLELVADFGSERIVLG